jgi:hypothetical protein
MIILGPSLTGLRGTQVTGSIIYTLVSYHMNMVNTMSKVIRPEKCAKVIMVH